MKSLFREDLLNAIELMMKNCIDFNNNKNLIIDKLYDVQY